MTKAAIMVPSLRIMGKSCVHGRGKPCRSQNYTRVLHETEMEMTLRKWVGILFQRAGRKNTHLWLWDQSVADTKTCILFVDKFFSTVHIMGISSKLLNLEEMKKVCPSSVLESSLRCALKVEGIHLYLLLFFHFCFKAENVLNKCVGAKYKTISNCVFHST